ncbi:YlcI/YnfO family protein [Geodermatophilus sp. FMUSA9-8]|uniref:YlcI/YnfO family protein n=1 Tax=Geodermatophilus sp. FMUSA9-8 TaxID=3120155 RepID=UPI003FA5E15E
MSTPEHDSTQGITPEQEHAFYADADNQVPQGPPVRRRARPGYLSAPVPVRFPEELLRQVRERAAADDRSLSQWIRRAVEHELARTT